MICGPGGNGPPPSARAEDAAEMVRASSLLRLASRLLMYWLCVSSCSWMLR